MFFFFFFQAEDGIRDHCVTGVQTCALPISGRIHCIGAGRIRRYKTASPGLWRPEDAGSAAWVCGRRGPAGSPCNAWQAWKRLLSRQYSLIGCADAHLPHPAVSSVVLVPPPSYLCRLTNGQPSTLDALAVAARRPMGAVSAGAGKPTGPHRASAASPDDETRLRVSSARCPQNTQQATYRRSTRLAREGCQHLREAHDHVRPPVTRPPAGEAEEPRRRGHQGAARGVHSQVGGHGDNPHQAELVVGEQAVRRRRKPCRPQDPRRSGHVGDPEQRRGRQQPGPSQVVDSPVSFGRDDPHPALLNVVVPTNLRPQRGFCPILPAHTRPTAARPSYPGTGCSNTIHSLSRLKMARSVYGSGTMSCSTRVVMGCDPWPLGSILVPRNGWVLTSGEVHALQDDYSAWNLLGPNTSAKQKMLQAERRAVSPQWCQVALILASWAFPVPSIRLI